MSKNEPEKVFHDCHGTDFGIFVNVGYYCPVCDETITKGNKSDANTPVQD